jgi:hypothetical protein
MRFAAIDPLTLHDALALWQVDSTMSTGHHFFSGRIMPFRGITPSARPALRPHPPDRRQERKPKQVFHRSPRKQNTYGKSISRYFYHISTPSPPHQMIECSNPVKQAEKRMESGQMEN